MSARIDVAAFRVALAALLNQALELGLDAEPIIELQAAAAVVCTELEAWRAGEFDPRRQRTRVLVARLAELDRQFAHLEPRERNDVLARRLGKSVRTLQRYRDITSCRGEPVELLPIADGRRR